MMRGSKPGLRTNKGVTDWSREAHEQDENLVVFWVSLLSFMLGLVVGVWLVG